MCALPDFCNLLWPCSFNGVPSSLLACFRIPEEKEPVYYPKIKYFEGSLIDDNKKEPIITDNYKAGKFDEYLNQDGEPSIFQPKNNFASIQFSIRKELDKKLSTKNQFKSDASTMTFPSEKSHPKASDNSSQTKTETKNQESQCLFLGTEVTPKGIPQGSTIKRSPQDNSMKCIPQVTQEKIFPQKVQIKETFQETPVKEMPQKIEISNISQETPIREILHETPITQVVQNNPIEKVPQKSEKMYLPYSRPIPKIEIHPPDDDLESIGKENFYFRISPLDRACL